MVEYEDTGPHIKFNNAAAYDVYADYITSFGSKIEIESNSIDLSSDNVKIHGNLQLSQNNKIDVDNITCRSNLTVSNDLITKNINVSNNLIVDNTINASNISILNDLEINNNLILNNDLQIKGNIDGDLITISRESIAIGVSAGFIGNNEYTIAIGNNAGNKNQGRKAIAIGYNAGEKDQCNNTIILNASDISLNSDFSYALYIAPIRKLNPSIKTSLLQYTNSYEIVESSNININNIEAISANLSNININNLAILNDVSFYHANANNIDICYIETYDISVLNNINVSGNINVNSITINNKFLKDELFNKYYDISLNNADIYGNISILGSLIPNDISSNIFKLNNNIISIGKDSGLINQGNNSIAIGNMAGYQDQCNNSIILNATNSQLNSTISNSLYIAPIRNLDPTIKTSLLQYTTSHEIVESSNLNINYIDVNNLSVYNNFITYDCSINNEANINSLICNDYSSNILKINEKLIAIGFNAGLSQELNAIAIGISAGLLQDINAIAIGSKQGKITKVKDLLQLVDGQVEIINKVHL